MPIGRLHLITPDATDASVLARTDAALAAGARWIQVRTKHGTDQERLAFARAVAGSCARHGATCLVDDRVDLAWALTRITAGDGAAIDDVVEPDGVGGSGPVPGRDAMRGPRAVVPGVHLGADDLPVALARRLLGPDAIIGATCRNAADARRAEADGASYLGVGPVYTTMTKVGLPDPIGLPGLADVCAETRLPVIAISGITLARVPEVLDAGAHGVAVVAAVYDAGPLAAVGEATAAFLDALAIAPVGAPS